MFHLDARIHLDEKPCFRILIVKKFHRAGVVVFDFFAQPHRRVAQFAANFFVQLHARRDFNYFLMTPLHRTIAFVQMNNIAVLVAKNLHLDVLRARDVAFEKYGGITERPARFALRFVEQIRQVARLVHHAHSASAAAERRLDDERKTNFLRGLQRLAAIFNRILGSRQNRHADFLRKGARGGFIAHVF